MRQRSEPNCRVRTQFPPMAWAMRTQPRVHLDQHVVDRRPHARRPPRLPSRTGPRRRRQPQPHQEARAAAAAASHLAIPCPTSNRPAPGGAVAAGPPPHSGAHARVVQQAQAGRPPGAGAAAASCTGVPGPGVTQLAVTAGAAHGRRRCRRAEARQPGRTGGGALVQGRPAGGAAAATELPGLHPVAGTGHAVGRQACGHGATSARARAPFIQGRRVGRAAAEAAAAAALFPRDPQGAGQEPADRDGADVRA